MIRSNKYTFLPAWGRLSFAAPARRRSDFVGLLPLLGGFLGVAILVSLALVVYFWLFAPPPSGRDLSTPSARLVGHWQLMIYDGHPLYDLYFGPVSPTGERKGRAIMVDDEGMTFKGYYSILKEDVTSNTLEISKEMSPNMVRNVQLILAKNGLRGRYRYRWFDKDTDQAMEYVNADFSPTSNPEH